MRGRSEPPPPPSDERRMIPRLPDVLVIGAGLAGLVARDRSGGRAT
jgi:NADPH-dependent 2,4-dienoyl-CoA reductase/sulfur reductase-like enzyme